MFTELPRYMGFPSQIWVKKRFAFDSFVRMFDGKRPMMVSTYQFKDKTTPIVDSLVFDIDSYFGLRIPYKNTKSLMDFCRENKLQYIVNYSGGKGFHLFIMFKPIIPKSEEEKEKLRDLLYSVQKNIVEQCKVEAIDYPTMGRLHWLIRFPTCKYIRYNDKSKAENNGFYCRNLSDDEFDSGLKKISKIVTEPGEIPKNLKTTKTIKDIVKILPKFKLQHKRCKYDKLHLLRGGNTVPTIEALGVPCLKEIAKHSHPTHYERIEIVAFLKHLGYTDLAINAFIRSLKWTRYSYPITSYQVSTIHPRFPKCSFLKNSYENSCKHCSLFKKKSVDKK